MEKVLFAADELTGLIWAAALNETIQKHKRHGTQIPQEEIQKQKDFAAGCSREVIERGAEQLGWELDKLLEMTIHAMAASEDKIRAEMTAEGLD